MYLHHSPLLSTCTLTTQARAHFVCRDNVFIIHWIIHCKRWRKSGGGAVLRDTVGHVETWFTACTARRWKKSTFRDTDSGYLCRTFRLDTLDAFTSSEPRFKNGWFRRSNTVNIEISSWINAIKFVSVLLYLSNWKKKNWRALESGRLPKGPTYDKFNRVSFFLFFFFETITSCLARYLILIPVNARAVTKHTIFLFVPTWFFRDSRRTFVKSGCVPFYAKRKRYTT